MRYFPCIAALSFFGISVCFFQTILAQSSQCELPTKQLGVCVHVQKCNNVFKILEKMKQTQTIPDRVAEYLDKIKCDLPGVPEGESRCCQLEQVRLLPEDCGRQAGDRLAGGTKAAVLEYPWMALLWYNETGKTELLHACGGTLISSRYVLTAAHCIKVKSTLQLDHVRLGEHTLNRDVDCNPRVEEDDEDDVECAGPVKNYKMESFVIHPNYRQFNYDIALLRLDQEVKFEDHIQPICLPAALGSISAKNYQIAGWGSTENGTDGSDVLLKANVQLKGIDECEANLNRHSFRKVRLNDSIHLCAGGEGIVDTCRGDSGGPLMGAQNINRLTRYVQSGVTSFGGAKCGRENSIGVYTKVATMMDWILENMKP